MDDSTSAGGLLIDFAVRIFLPYIIKRRSAGRPVAWKASTWQTAWPVKSRQMSIKSGPKLISLEQWKILTPLTNRLKMWQLGQNICCHRLRKIAQSAINHPIWSHWICCCSPWCRWTGRRASSRREEVRRGESRWGRRTLDLRDQLKWDKQKFR